MEFEIEDRPVIDRPGARAPVPPPSIQRRRARRPHRSWVARDCAIAIPEQEFGS
jgi:hypothetical protein